MPADRATSEVEVPGSKEAATRRSFFSSDQRRRSPSAYKAAFTGGVRATRYAVR